MSETSEILKMVLDHASFFLKEYGSFYPFAIVRQRDDVLKPLNIFEGDDIPSSTDLLNKLETVLESSFDRYGYDAFAIGIDVTVTRYGQKEDTIQIKFNDKGEYYEDCFVPYKIDSGSVELFDLYTENE